MSKNPNKRIKTVPIIRSDIDGYMYKFKSNGVDHISYYLDIPEDIPKAEPREQNFQCIICQRSFESKTCFQTHLSRVHNMNLKRKLPESDEKFELNKLNSVRTYNRKPTLSQPIKVKEEPNQEIKEEPELILSD